MKLNMLKTLLPDVYQENHSDSYEKLFNCSSKSLGYLGLNFQSSHFYSATSRLKRIISLGLLIFDCLLVAKELLIREWDDANYFNVSVVFGTLLMVGPRVLQMFLYRNELNELIEHVIKTTQSDRFTYLPVLEAQLYEKYLYISRTNQTNNLNYITFMTRVLTFLYHFLVLLMVYAPIAKKKWFLVFFTVAPWFGYESHPGYEISVILETYYSLFVVGFMAAFDTYFFYFTFYVLMKSDLYIAMISKIGDYNSEYDNAKKQSFLIRQLCLIQVDLKCFLTKLTSVFHVFVCGQGGFSLFVMTIGLLMLKSSFLNFIATFTLIATQLFFLCLFGEMVLTKASGMSNGIYCSYWYEIKSSKDKEILIHLLHNSQIKPPFTAMGVFDFSLATFAAIIQRAYGFYAFMQNIM